VRLHAVVALLAVLSLAGCSALRKPITYDEATFAAKEIPSYTVEVDGRGKPTETVIGKVETYTVRKGDTFLDIARYYDLGYNEIVDANPGIDPWVPKEGTEITLPTRFILPCCSYEGVVMNIPEMRLYRYERSEISPDTMTVHTYPVGLGRDDWKTPKRTFRVSNKTVNPRWDIPESIRREHIAERNDHRRSIPGGDPDNPLGKYRLKLSGTSYAIHGTNVPWGVGMLVSHGCVRLYPEDIERLYPQVDVGSRVDFVYQPVKVGTHDGIAYVEVHRDVYKYSGSLDATAKRALSKQDLDERIDRGVLKAAVEDLHGVPVQVSTMGSPYPTLMRRGAEPDSAAGRWSAGSAPLPSSLFWRSPRSWPAAATTARARRPASG
jgi:L,D-transpeptidase ErfK/SrfK